MGDYSRLFVCIKLVACVTIVLLLGIIIVTIAFVAVEHTLTSPDNCKNTLGNEWDFDRSSGSVRDTHIRCEKTTVSDGVLDTEYFWIER